MSDRRKGRREGGKETEGKKETGGRKEKLVDRRQKGRKEQKE